MDWYGDETEEEEEEEEGISSPARPSTVSQSTMLNAGSGGHAASSSIGRSGTGSAQPTQRRISGTSIGIGIGSNEPTQRISGDDSEVAAYDEGMSEWGVF